jgi:hypothetical protein
LAYLSSALIHGDDTNTGFFTAFSVLALSAAIFIPLFLIVVMGIATITSGTIGG